VAFGNHGGDLGRHRALVKRLAARRKALGMPAWDETAPAWSFDPFAERETEPEINNPFAEVA
jgi:hypothetical protein